MNCKYYKCDKVAQHPYPCCSINHGVKVKEITKLLQTPKEDLTGYGLGSLMELSDEQIEYYKKLI